MSVLLELVNVGNAPAVEVLVDAELTLRYSEIQGNRVIPARFEPDVIPFIKPGETNLHCAPSFGNKAIIYFFDDVRESFRLNMQRIKSDATKDSFPASRLKIICYYNNSLSQRFRSYYETEIDLFGQDDKSPIPDDKVVQVTMIYIPRPVYHATPITDEEMKSELAIRNELRIYSGW
jgi:hypothetical protein